MAEPINGGVANIEGEVDQAPLVEEAPIDIHIQIPVMGRVTFGALGSVTLSQRVEQGEYYLVPVGTE